MQPSLRVGGRGGWVGCVVRPGLGLAVALIVSAATLQAQTGVLVGQVRTGGGESLAGVEVRVDSTALAVVSDSSGHYRLSNIPVGGANLTAQAPGYNSVRVGGLTIVDGQTVTQDLVLESLLPENGQFLAAAYIVAGCIYLAYTMSLLARASRAGRQR